MKCLIADACGHRDSKVVIICSRTGRKQFTKAISSAILVKPFGKCNISI